MRKSIRLGLISLALFGFAIPPAAAAELHGHRGARGLAPENTIPAFEEALRIGVDCLELDVAMSRDGVLVISHDPVLNPDIVRRDGQWITERTPLKDMSLDDIGRLDVGRLASDTKYASRYPRQRQIDGVRMPRLTELLELPGLKGAPGVCLNIEIKTFPTRPDVTHAPERMADALIATVSAAGLRGRLRVQSFDWRSLAHLGKAAPDIPLSFLTAQQSWLDNIKRGRPGASPWLAGHDIDAEGGSIPQLVKKLRGAYWSPYYREVDAESLAEARGLGLKVLVWTVNESVEIKRLLKLGVDGIITDYPDVAKSVM